MNYEMKENENENETLVVMEGGERDLRERTKAFALRIIKLFVALPKRAEAQVLGKQVLRSGTSVGANYCEAWRARDRGLNSCPRLVTASKNSTSQPAG